MTDMENRFEHDRSPYERPNFPYRCGREAAFGRPCPRGPTSGGACQGAADCAPFQTRKVVTDAETGEEREILRWECRRPAYAGGPCAEGPRPDGSCSCTHPPCAPRPTIRRQRGRWALIAVAAVVSIVLALAGLSGEAELPSSLSAGPLSGKHAQFTAGEGCVACHAGHSETLTGWATALFETSTISDSCVSCHAFGDGGETEAGPLIFAAHNTSFPDKPALPSADCQGCHTEHRGEHASITPILDGQCATCHENNAVADHSGGHPAFAANFPYENPRTIKFPHAAHFGQHFQDARYADLAPKDGCLTCHTDQADGRLLPGSFEVGCAGCHEAAIKEQGFAVFGLPELTDPALTADAADYCGFAAPEVEPVRAMIEAMNEALPAFDSLREAVDSGDIEAATAATEALQENVDAMATGKEDLDYAIDKELAVSFDLLAPAQAYLLGVPADDPDAYSEAAAEFLVAAAADGRAALAEAVENQDGDPAILLAGLTAEMVTRVTCAWTANAEYEPVEYPEPGMGWAADATRVTYMPTGHADAVVKGWIGLALAARGSDAEGAEAFSDALLDPSEGPGRCFKCHVAPSEAEPVGWAIPRRDIRPFTTFDHTPHLNVLAKGTGCETCHAPLGEGETLTAEQSRPGDFANDFKPVVYETCAECHHDGGVRADCGLCHRYHRDPSIRKRTM